MRSQLLTESDFANPQQFADGQQTTPLRTFLRAVSEGVTGIETALFIGGLVGAVAGLVPRAKFGCGALAVIPLAMLIYTVIQLNDPNRRPDALDALLYVFNPLWPSLGAVLGFGLVRLLQALAFQKDRNGS